jgi:hypothetical protein
MCDPRAHRTMSAPLITEPDGNLRAAPMGVFKIANELDLLHTRRGILQAASAFGMALAGTRVSTARSTETTDSQPARGGPSIDLDLTTADILIDTLIRWDVQFVFGIVGDGINSIIEALRKREDITGSTFHDLGGTHFMQAVDTQALMRDVSIYNTAITGPLHGAIVGNLACRSALGKRGVAHLTIAKDTQAMTLGADKPSMENHGLRTLDGLAFSHPVPDTERLQQAANLINEGTKVAILVGQGALDAREEVTQRPRN